MLVRADSAVISASLTTSHVALLTENTLHLLPTRGVSLKKMTVVLGDFGVLELAGTLHRVAGGVHSDSHAMGHQLRRMFHFHFPSSTLPAQRGVDQRSQTQELSLSILPRMARTPARARDLERPGAILSSDLELSLSILRQRPGATWSDSIQ